MLLRGCVRVWRGGVARGGAQARALSAGELRPDLHWLADADDAAAGLTVHNPATHARIASVPDHSLEDVRQAIAGAHAAFPRWSVGQTAKERSDALLRWHGLVVANTDYLARLITAESGKVLAEAMAEVTYGASFLKWFAEEARRVYGDVIPADGTDMDYIVRKEPVGVCALITPWNFPAGMITRKAGAALAAGCTAVLKPSEDTPLTAQALVALAHQAGIPQDALSVVTCGRDSVVAVGQELATNALVRKVSFTGSTAVGKQLMAWATGTVKRVSMELGGNAPFIVFEDADLDAAVQGAIASKFRNAGQTCVCSNRILVHASVKDEFVAKLAGAMGALTVGNGIDPASVVGPLINEQAAQRVDKLMTSAKAAGATVVVGGGPHELGGNFYSPTLLTDVHPGMELFRSELFGPIAPVYTFDTEEQAVALANDTTAGLVSYFYTQDAGRVFRVSKALQSGMVGVNTGLVSTEVAPFGGVKESGVGREGSHYGLNDYLDVKYIKIAHG